MLRRGPSLQPFVQSAAFNQDQTSICRHTETSIFEPLLSEFPILSLFVRDWSHLLAIGNRTAATPDMRPRLNN
jgi:hypothetical protein